MNDLRPPKLETILFVLAFALALFLRLLNLGQAPLSDAEASWALEALKIARPALAGAAGYPSQPGPISLAGVTFLLAGANDFLARFWPALCGALLVWAAYMFRESLGRRTALILAYGLAVDPGLVVVARQAGGPMPAIAFTLVALGFWRAGKPTWTGIFAGLALLSGPALWPGLLALLAAAWLTRLAWKRSIAEDRANPYDWEELGPADQTPGSAWKSSDWLLTSWTPTDRRRAFIAALVTFLLAGSVFFMRPQLLGAFGGSFAEYFEGWARPSGVAPSGLVFALLAFEVLVLIFALVHAIRLLLNGEALDTERTALAFFAVIWLFASLVLALAYPGRQVSDLAWALVPLWMLSAAELAYYIPVGRPHVMSFLQAALVIFLGGFFWLTLITNQQMVNAQVSWSLVQLIILVGILILGVLTTSLVALGWSWEISRDGLVWGSLALLLVYSVSALWSAAQLRPNQPQEYWGEGAAPGQTRLFVSTIEDLSNWNTGMKHDIDVLSTVDTPSMRWALRDFSEVRFAGGLPSGDSPSIVVTPLNVQSTELDAAYRGQDFVWWTRPGWSGSLPPSLKDWLTFRRVPLNNDYIILWARTDLFPGAAE